MDEIYYIIVNKYRSPKLQINPTRNKMITYNKL